jgi:hypothetical protein
MSVIGTLVAANHQLDSASAVLKCVSFRAAGAKPEVLHRVRVRGRPALRMASVKAKQASLPIIVKRGRALRIRTLRKQEAPPAEGMQPWRVTQTPAK